jgi:hypothetical protein
VLIAIDRLWQCVIGNKLHDLLTSLKPSERAPHLLRLLMQLVPFWGLWMPPRLLLEYVGQDFL